jgi:hypothetical protein
MPIAELKADLVARFNDLNSATAEITEIQQRLNSWGFVVKGFVGLAAENVTDEKHLHMLPNDQLSQADLLRKQTLLQAKVSTLNNEIRIRQDELHSLEVAARKQKVQNSKDHAKDIAVTAVAEYQAHPANFVKLCLQDHATTSDEIFNSADRITNACSAFNKDSMNYVTFLELWNKVSLARDRAANDYQQYIRGNMKDDLQAQKLADLSTHYYNTAKEMFNVVLNFIPEGFKGIKFLYEIGEYERVEYYLNSLHVSEAKHDDQDIIDLIVELSIEVNHASRKQARAILNTNLGFSRLESDLQEQLIGQQAFVNQLRFDLSQITDENKGRAIDELSDYAEKLNLNINNAILQTDGVNENAKQYDAIIANIRSREQSIRRELFKRQLTDEGSKFALGAGLGLGWLLGAPALVAGAAVVAKAKYESNTAKIVEIDQELRFAQSIPPIDYSFLHDEDIYWGVHQGVTAENATISGGSLAEQFNEKLQKLQDELKQKIIDKKDEATKALEENIQTNITDPLNQKKEQALNTVNIWKKAAIAGIKVFLGAQVIVAIALAIAAGIMLAVGVAAPPLWPLLIGLGLGLIGGLVFGLVKGLVVQEAPAHKILDLVINGIYFPARPLVKTAEFIFVRPIKSIINTFDSGREKQGYAVVIASVALAITFAFVLPIIAPAIGIFAAGLIGTLGGAFAGLGIGALVRDFQIHRDKRKEDKQNTAATETQTNVVHPPAADSLSANNRLTIPPESIAALENMSSGLSNKLLKHFQRREAEIKVSLDQAIAQNNQTAGKDIGERLTRLEKDWNVILLSSKDPALFSEVVEKYLRDTYQYERKIYIQKAEQRKVTTEASDKPNVVNEKRKNMVFSAQPDFKMEFNVDYAAERAILLELHEMGNSIRAIKK